MWTFPERASTIAGQVDLLFLALIGLSGFFVLLIFGLIVYFAVKYRRGSGADRSNPPEGSNQLEIAWSVIPLLMGLPVFIWAANIYFQDSRPPAEALEIHVIGQQWMWKTQHPDGQREINELHVPVNTPITLQMISQDVIHSFWVPDFRLKQDVLPGRYTTMWFEATKTGQFPIRCAEYCGTEHATMVGSVIVMEPADYQNWLSGGAATESLAQQGERLFQRQGCESCHQMDDSGRGPSLAGVFGQTVALRSGETVTADASYVRESILNPQARIVAGYEPIMPSFEGQLNEEELVALINYIQSLSEAPASGQSGGN